VNLTLIAYLCGQLCQLTERRLTIAPALEILSMWCRRIQYRDGDFQGKALTE
jgi:hypothetical protein